MNAEVAPLSFRMSVFRAWLRAMDEEEMSMIQSRQTVADRFGISVATVRSVEQEGLERGWDESSEVTNTVVLPC